MTTSSCSHKSISELYVDCPSRMHNNHNTIFNKTVAVVKYTQAASNAVNHSMMLAITRINKRKKRRFDGNYDVYKLIWQSPPRKFIVETMGAPVRAEYKCPIHNIKSVHYCLIAMNGDRRPRRFRPWIIHVRGGVDCRGQKKTRTLSETEPLHKQ